MTLGTQVILRRSLAFVPSITYSHEANWNLLKLLVVGVHEQIGQELRIVGGVVGQKVRC